MSKSSLHTTAGIHSSEQLLHVALSRKKDRGDHILQKKRATTEKSQLGKLSSQKKIPPDTRIPSHLQLAARVRAGGVIV
jgi:hypothetical protein